jgi:hypothetical protein
VWSKFQLEQLRPLFPGTLNEKKFWDTSSLRLSLRSPPSPCIFTIQFIISLRIIGAVQFDLVILYSRLVTAL